MDFCLELRILEEALLDCQEKEGSLIEPCNEEKVCAISKFLKTKLINVLQRDESSDRKLNLFLILNSDLLVRNSLLDDYDYGHLVNSAICINGELLVKIVCNLSLQKYFCEGIVLCPPPLSIELLVFAVKAINTLDFNVRASLALDIAGAIYMKINRIESFQETTDRENVKHLYSKLYAYFVTLIEFCLEINKEETSNDPVAVGRRLMNILKLMNLCLRVYLEKDMIHPFEEYKIALQYEVSDSQSSSNICHQQFINHLVEMFIEDTKNLTFGLWCDLSEILHKDLGGNSTRTYQQIIGEDSFLCLQLLNELKGQSSKESPERLNDLLAILPACSIKPYDEDDEIQNADFDLILKKVSDKLASRDKWLMAMLNFDTTEHILSMEECLLTLEENVEVIKLNQIDVVLDHITSALKLSINENHDRKLKKLAISSIKHFPYEDQIQVVKAYFDKYGASTFLLTEEYNGAVVEVMNKAICIDEDGKQEFYAEFVELFFQSPRALLLRMLMEGLANANQASLMTEIMKTLHPACLCYEADQISGHKKYNLITSVLIELIGRADWSEQELDNFVILVLALVSNLIIPTREVLEECLFPAILSVSLASCQWDVLVLYLKTVKELIRTSVDYNIPALLVVLGQILDTSRCDLSNFTPQAMLVCEEASAMMSSLVDRQRKLGIDVSTLAWLKNKLMHMSPISKSIFRKIFVKKNEKDLSKCLSDEIFFDLIYSNTISPCYEETVCPSEIREKVLHFFVKFLPVLTCHEWKSIHKIRTVTGEETDSVVWLFYIIADSFLLISSVVCEEYEDNECATASLNYCLRNFAAFIQSNVMPLLKSMTYIEAKKIFSKIVYVLERLPTSIRDTCTIFYVVILVQLVADTFSYSEVDNDCDRDSVVVKLCSIIALSSVPQARIVLSQKLAELK